MPKLKTGGSRRSAKASTASASLRRKRKTSSDPGRLLTRSEIDTLKSAIIKVYDELDRIIANDPSRCQPQAACEDTMPKLVSLEPAGAYTIRVRFADGVEGEIDLAQELKGEMFEPLRDPQLFAQFRLDPDTRTIVWPNGADLAPEFVRQMLRAVA